MSAFTTANPPGFLQCVEQAFNGFGFDSEDAVGSAARFEAAERDWFSPYDRAHPHILENFLLNEIGGSFFPLGKEWHGIEREWMAIMVLYALVRFYLIGLAGFYREQFSGEHYVRLIQSVCRVISHNAGFLKQVHLELGKHGMDNLASIAILIRE
jgi:lysine-N-methylase